MELKATPENHSKHSCCMEYSLCSWGQQSCMVFVYLVVGGGAWVNGPFVFMCCHGDHPNTSLYLGTGHQLRGGESALGGGGDDPVLHNCVLGDLRHVLGLQHQHGGGVGHRFGQIHQDVLQQPTRSSCG